MKPGDAGLYGLVLRLKRRQTIKVGKWGKSYFEAGLYLYIGRAQRGLRRRLERHLRKDKRLFWHIDYFLEKAEVKEVWVKPDSFDECGTVQKVRKRLKNPEIAHRKFGASDCRCPGHLLYLPVASELENLRKQVGFKKL